MWKNKVHGEKKHFLGKYEREKSGERVFILTDGKRRITFESWQLAYKAGWRKVK